LSWEAPVSSIILYQKLSAFIIEKIVTIVNLSNCELSPFDDKIESDDEEKSPIDNFNYFCRLCFAPFPFGNAIAVV